MPRSDELYSYVAENCRFLNSANELIPVRKFCDDVIHYKFVCMQPPENDEKPVDSEETCVFGFRVVCSLAVVQMQVETKKLTSTLLLCNTSMHANVFLSLELKLAFLLSQVLLEELF